MQCMYKILYTNFRCQGFFSTVVIGRRMHQVLLSSAIDHASSEPHKHAMVLVMKQKGMNVLERSQAMQGVLDSQKQGNILSALATLNEQDLERTKKKFQIAYYVAKEELPIVKFSTMLDLEERLGVDVGTAYRNNNSYRLHK